MPVIEESASYLAQALLSITNLLALDQIILAGPGFGAAGEIYVRRAWQELEQLSFVRAVHPTSVELSKAGASSAALGAASLVLHSRLMPTRRPTGWPWPTRARLQVSGYLSRCTCAEPRR